MACLKSLKTDYLSGADAGGVWTYTGASAITVTITGLGSTVLNPTDVVDPGNDDPELDFDTLVGLACGVTHSNAFTYTGGAGGCEDTATVDLLIECPPDAGGDIGIALCDNDATRIVFNDLPGTPWTTGVWTGTGVGSAGHAAGGAGPTDDTFDPSLVVPGVYTFIYTVSSTAADCPCPDDVHTITYTVSAAFEAGTGATIEMCA